MQDRLLFIGLVLLTFVLNSAAQAAEGEPAAADSPPTFLLQVPLPITGLVDSEAMARIERFLRTVPAAGPRGILVLEFRGTNDAAAKESQFERALALARFLASERLNRVKTVAYLPQTVTGHAVLPILACEQIIMQADAELGAAGITETTIDPTLRRGYSEIAERRRTIPTAVALGMLDRSLSVSRVQTPAGVRYVLADELKELQQQGMVTTVETVIREGELGQFSGRELRVKHGFISHLAEDRAAVAAALEIPRSAIDTQPQLGEGWKPIRVVIDGPIHPRQVTQIIRGVGDASRRGEANLVVIHLRSAGGNFAESLRLASFLALDLNPDQIRSVVYLDREARGDAALIALAANDLVAASGVIIGGPGAAAISPAEVTEALPMLQTIAKARQREWSLLASLLDPQREIFRYTHGQRNEDRFYNDEERGTLPDADEWQRGDALNCAAGIKADELQGTDWLRGMAAERSELARMYGWPEPVRELRPNWVLNLVEFLADPRIAGLLLFFAMATLMMEMSSPGIGAPGFISALCFLLYFWSQFLHGTAGILEILLFLFGVACIAIELFVIPGTGVFGLGGGALVIASIILASQTFFIPTNSYQLRQLPISLFMMLAALGGGAGALFVIRRFLPNTPFFNRLLLPPPEGATLTEMNRRESFADWAHLVGKRGVATTTLVPAGKARFGEELVDVLSEGELIERGTPVEVLEAQGSRVIVRAIGS